MDSPEDAVFFPATPHNITAFLIAHRWADMTAIGTVDGKTFLTAQMGFIETCPDQEYLASKIIPVYSPCLIDLDKTIELETVPKEVAQSAPCPIPDWNYLRWDGYSDKKYQAIQSGDGLLKLPRDGKTISLDCQVRSYYIITHTMHMNVSAAVMPVRVGTYKGLVSGEVFPAKFLA